MVCRRLGSCVGKAAVLGMKSGESRNELRPVKGDGAEGQTRTVDTGIFSAVLYHLSYLGRDTYLNRAS